jgi:inosine/guanosine/xanthosine phosphorylase family protein
VVGLVQVEQEISFGDLPGFPAPTVSGHAGRLLAGRWEDTPVLLLSGRGHYYEGLAMEEVVLPVRVLAALGIQHLLLTNAAGGINRRLRPGDLMLLSDHINFIPAHPLRGPAPEGRERFVDLTQTYDPHLSALLKRAARQVGVRLRSGVYLAVSGPSFETPAEIRAFARLGADAVGMSTVPEAIVARQCGLAVAGLSCVTNLAAGLGPHPLSHAEVLAAGRSAQERVAALLAAFVRLYRCDSV